MALVGPGCKLGWREATEARVRAAAVVVGLPRRNQLAGMRQRAEQALVQALVAEPAVEALDERILDRLAWLDVVPGDVSLLAPAQDSGRGQFRAVVADDQRRLAALVDQPIEFAGHAPPRQRRVGDERQALAREVVDDAQHPEPAAVVQRIRHEVEALSA